MRIGQVRLSQSTVHGGQANQPLSPKMAELFQLPIYKPMAIDLACKRNLSSAPLGPRARFANYARRPGLVREDEATDIVKVRKRQERSAQTRDRVLAAATAEFSKSGFNGATSRSIAERADVPHALVIYHFKTKLGIWRAVMEKVITDFHDELARESEQHRDSDAVTALRASQRLFISMSASRPELNWLMSHEMGSDSERLSWFLEKVAGRDIDNAIELIREAQKQGRFVAGDPAHLHFLFVGAASRVFLMPAEIERKVGCSPFDDEFLERHIMLCESLFFRDPPEPAQN